MNQLDELTRRALCAGDQPPPGVEDRILAAIVGPFGGPGPDGGGASQAPASGSGSALGQTTIAYAAKIVAATLGLAVGGVAVVAIAAAGLRTTTEKPPTDPVERIEAAAPVERVTAGTVAELGQPQLEAPELVDAAPELDSAPAESEPAPSVKSSKASKLGQTDDDNGIEAELEWMKVARGSKDPKAALLALDGHRSEFPNGVFTAEREVLRVENLCALGRTAEAKTVAAAFLARFPSNPLRSRVEPACPGTDHRAPGHRNH